MPQQAAQPPSIDLNVNFALGSAKLTPEAKNELDHLGHVAARDALRTGVDRGRAIDVVWTLNSPDVYALLSRSRGWSDDEYEDWLRRSLIDSLLGEPG